MNMNSNMLFTEFNPFVDTRVDSKVGTFSGEDREWGLWSLKFESHAGLLGWDASMALAAQQVVVLSNDEFGPQHAACSKALWHLLISKCEGRAFGIIRSALCACCRKL